MEIALPLTRRKRRSLVETHDADMVPSAGPSSPTSEAARRVLWIEARMERECPQVISEAKSLAEATLDPARASPAQIWSVLWHKPLFAYTHVAIGQSYIQRLECFVANERWREWGDPSRPFVALAGPANREASFSITPFAPPVLATLGIAKGRLFAIQGAAQALGRWEIAAANAPLAPFLTLTSVELVLRMRRELGPRWGHITIMHFLTDLGLACKPDRWLSRSASWMRLVNSVRPEQAQPSLRDAITIDAAVQQLVRDIDGHVSPQRLRYFDKILMEASRQGILAGPLLPVA